MKRSSIVAMLLLAAVAGQSQLTYDYSAGEFVGNQAFDQQTKKVLPVRNNSFARMKIININTFRYKVELSGQSVNYVTPVPSELQAVFRLSAESFSDKNVVEALRLANGAAKAMEEKKEEVKSLASDAGPNDELKKTMKELVAACEEYVDIAKKIANFKYRKMELITSSKQKWNSYTDMQAALPPPLSASQMKQDYNEFTEYYAKAYALYDKAAEVSDAAQNKAAAVGVVAAQNTAAQTKKAVEKAEEDFEKAFDLFAEDNLLKLIEDITLLQKALAKEEYFTVESGPIQIEGDFMEFRLKITPAQLSNLMPYEAAQEKAIQLPVKGGLKVDFSVGPVLSFGSRSRDDVFYTEPSTTTPANIILRQGTNKNAAIPGLVAMMHFGLRSGREWRPALMVGVGAGFQSSSNANLSLYGGLSSVFGKRERIMASLGWGYMRVDRLKAGEYVVGKDYPATDFKVENVTTKVYQYSFFIGISYNLTNRLDVR